MRIVGDLVFAGLGQAKSLRWENLAADPATPAVGQVWYNTTDGVYRGYDGTEVITFATGGSTDVLQLEIDQIEASAGLETDGTYVAPVGSNYLGSTTTLKGAAVALDTAVKANADAVAAETTARQAADTTLQANIDAETTARQAADTTLQANIDAEATARQAADTTLQANIDAEATARQAADTALDGRLTTVEGAFINKDGSVAFTGDQSMGSHKLTDVAAPTANADAANKEYVDNKLSSIGSALNYVSTINGGADEPGAFDLSTLSDISTGDYYLVAATGYFKDTDVGTPYLLNLGDAIIKNTTANGWDKIDNTDPIVSGTLDFVTVTGNADVGYVVDVHATFKNRVSTLETDLAAETTARQAADTTLQSNIDAEATARQAADTTLQANIDAEATARQAADTTLQANIDAEVTARTAAVTGVQTEIDLIETSLGINTDGSFTQLTGTNYLNAATTIIALSQALDTALAALATKVSESTFIYNGSVANASHTVTHNLGTQYCNVTVVDSNDKVIIPESITFDSTTGLTVTFASAITCKVVVTSIKV